MILWLQTNATSLESTFKLWKIFKELLTEKKYFIPVSGIKTKAKYDIMAANKRNIVGINFQVMKNI